MLILGINVSLGNILCLHILGIAVSDCVLFAFDMIKAIIIL